MNKAIYLGFVVLVALRAFAEMSVEIRDDARLALGMVAGKPAGLVCIFNNNSESSAYVDMFLINGNMLELKSAEKVIAWGGNADPAAYVSVPSGAMAFWVIAHDRLFATSRRPNGQSFFEFRWFLLGGINKVIWGHDKIFFMKSGINAFKDALLQTPEANNDIDCKIVYTSDAESLEITVIVSNNTDHPVSLPGFNTADNRVALALGEEKEGVAVVAPQTGDILLAPGENSYYVYAMADLPAFRASVEEFSNCLCAFVWTISLPEDQVIRKSLPLVNFENKFPDYVDWGYQIHDRTMQKVFSETNFFALPAGQSIRNL